MYYAVYYVRAEMWGPVVIDDDSIWFCGAWPAAPVRVFTFGYSGVLIFG